MAKKHGICRNVDGDCSLAANKTIQEAEATSFVCEECGMELKEVEPKGKKKPKGKKTGGSVGTNKKLGGVIAGIAAAILLGGIAFFLLKGKGDKAPAAVPVESITLDQTDFTKHETDPFAILAFIEPEDATDKAVTWTVTDEQVLRNNGDGTFVCLKAGETDIVASAGGKSASCHLTVLPIDSGVNPPGPDRPAGPKLYSLGWGTYSGPMQGGKPHGLGGEVTVTKAYTLDLKKGNGDTRSLGRGDKIVDCKFKEGRLVSGYIHYSDGRQERINIGA